nr:hypothetical protein ABT39_MTgene1060 [Picea glauca]
MLMICPKEYWLSTRRSDLFQSISPTMTKWLHTSPVSTGNQYSRGPLTV